MESDGSRFGSILPQRNVRPKQPTIEISCAREPPRTLAPKPGHWRNGGKVREITKARWTSFERRSSSLIFRWTRKSLPWSMARGH